MLQLSDELSFERVFRDAAIGIALLDLRGRWLRVNDAAVPVIGRPRDSLLACDVASVTHGDDLPLQIARMQELIAGGADSFEMDKRFVDADGRVTWARLSMSLVRDSEGAPQLFISQLQDISARHAAEEARDAFFALSPDMLAIADDSGRLIQVNPAWERVLGWNAAELCARPFLEFVHPDDQARTVAEATRLYDGGAVPPGGFRNRYRTKAGDYRWLEWSTRAASDGRLYCCARDVTDEQRARHALEDVASRNSAALLNAQQRLDQHVHNTPLASIEWDCEFRVARWSPRAAELFGWSEAEVLGKSLEDWRFVHEDDTDRCAGIARALVDGDDARALVANRNYTRDGRVLHCEWFNSALFDERGELQSILSLAQDVTDREAALAAMRDSEARFRATFEQAAVGIAHVGLDGRWLRVNRTLSGLLGYTRDELMARTFHELTHADDLGGDLVSLQRLVEGTLDHYSVEKRYFHRDGRLVWALLTVSLLRDADGRPLHFISVIEDISARKATELALQQAHDELEARVEARTRELAGANHDLATEVGQRRDAEAALRDSEERVRGILENSYDAFVAIDDAGLVTEWNRSAEAMFGWRRSEILGRALHDAIVPAHLRDAHVGGMARFQASGISRVIGQRLQLNAMHRNGHEFPVEITISASRSGERRLFTAFLHDISDRVQAERQLRASEARLRTVTENVPVLIAYIDHELRYRFNNATYREWFGQAPEQLTGRPVAEVLGAEVFAGAEPHMRRVLTGERVHFELTLPRADGGVRHVDANYIPDIDADGRVRGFYLTANDVSAHKQLSEVLAKRALVDELTGLPNRAGWADLLERGLARAQRSGAPAVVMFLDLDGLKQVNDLHGHEAGDALLREFAARLAASVRKSDTVARLAGDEFVVLLENVNDPARDPATVARKILAAMAPMLEYRGHGLPVAASIGVAVQHAGAFDADALMRRADEAMYRAKRQGANRFELVED